MFDVLDAIYSTPFLIARMGGDFVDGSTDCFQKIHSDMGRARPLSGAKGSIHSIDEPPVVAVNFVVQDLTRWNGAMRIITWAQMAEWRGDTPPSLEKEPQEWLASRLWPLRDGLVAQPSPCA